MKVWIDKCYCIDATFESLVAQAKRDNLTLPQLADQAGCGLRCGWCIAYLRRALETGEIGFDTLLPKERLELPEVE